MSTWAILYLVLLGIGSFIVLLAALAMFSGMEVPKTKVNAFPIIFGNIVAIGLLYLSKFFLVTNWPQITLLCIYGIGTFQTIALHGDDLKSSSWKAFLSILSTIATWVLLYYGGFFGTTS